MSGQERWRELPGKPRPLPAGLTMLLWVLLAAGVLTFLLEATGPNRLRVWQIYLVNFLFWSGMAQGGLVFAATYEIVRAGWGGTVRRLAEGLGVFMPVSFLLFFVLFIGRETLFPWILDPVPEKKAWLNVTFLFARDAIGLFLLYGVGLAYLYYSLRPDVGTSDRPAGRLAQGIYNMFTRDWRGLAAEVERRQDALVILAPLYILLYTLVFSLLGFDLAMSLDPHWYSTLFGAYFFMSSFYLGLAATAIIAVFARSALGLEGHITQNQFHDLGKLLFGFGLVTGDFFWSQFVVIWYGNVPEETGYIILRAMEMPWAPLSWGVLVVTFIIPFFVLLSRRVKQVPSTMFAVGVMIAAGMWLERYVLVVPSLWHGEVAPFGWLEAGVTAGFLGAAGLSYVFFLRHFPLLPLVGSAPSPISSHPEGNAS